jgi:hypothetical protein
MYPRTLSLSVPPYCYQVVVVHSVDYQESLTASLAAEEKPIFIENLLSNEPISASASASSTPR